MPKQRILFVDDEVNVLNGLQRMLLFKKLDWDMHFATLGRKALLLMEKEPFDAIVTDERMPEIGGAELLSTVASRYPETVRFMLSGMSDRKTFYGSAKCAHRFIPKPCNAETLTGIIMRAFALRDLLKSEKLKTLVTKIRVIPSLPSIYFELVEELKSPNASAEKAGRIIEKDIGMTAKILQLANSAFFGRHQRISNPVHAATLIGLEALKSLVLVLHVFLSLDNIKVPGFSPEELFAHSMAIARGAKGIAAAMGCNDRTLEDAFLAGLFHDLGKLVLAANLPEHYGEAMGYHLERGLSLAESEASLFGSSHAEVGAYVLGLWGFADPIVEACAFHHNPYQVYEKSFSALTAVHSANAMYHDLYASNSSHSTTLLDHSYLTRLGLQNSLGSWRRICQKGFIVRRKT